MRRKPLKVVRSRWTRQWQFALRWLVLVVLAWGPATASGTAGASTPQQLVERLITALNQKDAEMLSSIYQGPFPYTLCNSFEVMLTNALADTRFFSATLILQDLKASAAVVTVPPRTIPTVSTSGRIAVVFGLRWSYVAQAKEDDTDVSEDLDLVVSWEIKEYDDGWRVVVQRTSPCGP